MVTETEIWQGVPEPTETVNFIVDEPEKDQFTLVCDKEVAGYDVVGLLYLVGGIWRVIIEDQDDDEEVPSIAVRVMVDRRYAVDTVRQAVVKLLENLYLHEQ
jgi:hypothetical protein